MDVIEDPPSEEQRCPITEKITELRVFGYEKL